MTNWHETLKLLDPALIVLLCSMEILIIYIFDRCTVQHCHSWLYHGWLSLYCPLDGHGKLLWTGRQRTAHYKCGWSNAENLTSRLKIGQSLIWYAGLLVRWDDHLMYQAFDAFLAKSFECSKYKPATHFFIFNPSK